jgi:hypothetical protein
MPVDKPNCLWAIIRIQNNLGSEGCPGFLLIDRVTPSLLTVNTPAFPPFAPQASVSPVASGKRARSTTPSLVGGRRAKPQDVYTGPVAPMPPARARNRLRPSSASGSSCPPKVRVALPARPLLQREAAATRAARMAPRAESAKDGVRVLHRDSVKSL